jgi:hypothetical protein
MLLPRQQPPGLAAIGDVSHRLLLSWRHFSVAVKPRTNHRCAKTKISSGDTMTTSVPAMAIFHSGIPLVPGTTPADR